jgi:hypothetical protein
LCIEFFIDVFVLIRGELGDLVIHTWSVIIISQHLLVILKQAIVLTLRMFTVFSINKTSHIRQSFQYLTWCAQHHSYVA